MSTYVIAEMACSHEGDPALAQRIIEGAGEAGANAIQFQILDRAAAMVPWHHDFELLGELELSPGDWQALSSDSRTRYPEMDIIACVSEPGSVDLAESLGADAYKLHASDLSNPTLIEYVAKTGRRVDLCVGAATLVEIAEAIECIRMCSNSEIWLMYGFQAFPTPVDQIHLGYMEKLARLFELPIAYQDHSDAETDAAFWLPAAALGMGVGILEKHITHDRSLQGIDHEAALNHAEFRRFVEMVRTIESATGISVPRPFSEDEIRYRNYARKSAVAARDLPAGVRVTRDDLAFMRAGSLGIPPDRSRDLIGKRTRSSIAQYSLIREEDVE